MTGTCRLESALVGAWNPKATELYSKGLSKSNVKTKKLIFYFLFL
jgi:hypothetical protein